MTSDSDDAVFRNASWRTVTRVCTCYTKLFNKGSVSLRIVEQARGDDKDQQTDC